MRAFLAVMLLSALLPGCTPYIPIKDDFGNSALTAKRDVPPEFAEFNNYDPAINALVANQICATPYEELQARSVGASTGEIIEARGRCAEHIPLIGP
ncbi:MAG TPA: hypothetical protein VME41_10005 [Stellaceae bacterium]|nr:hypothetical protein [Stellaceae bacterium]